MSGEIEAHVSHLGDSNRQCVVRMFGPTTVLLGKRSLGSRDFGGRKPRQLFELLVLARGAAVPKDRLADLIWGDELPANVAATIETNISVLRSALDPGGSWGRRLVLTEPDAYRIDESLVELDLDTFSSLVTAAGLEQGPDRLLHLREAIEMASGEVLIDEGYVDWAVRVRERYQIDVVLAQIDAAGLARDHGEAGLALEFAEAALDSEPLSEPAMICKLGALADLQRRTEAIRAGDRFVTQLKDELGAAASTPLLAALTKLRGSDSPRIAKPDHHDGRSMRVLLVEDNPADARLVYEALADHGSRVEITHVGDGEAALAELRAGSPDALPDLVLLDLNLPRLDGREVLEIVKQDKILRRVPVVVLTTSDAEQDILRCYDLHANSYITKPQDYDSFARVVRSIEAYWPATAGVPRS